MNNYSLSLMTSSFIFAIIFIFKHLIGLMFKIVLFIEWRYYYYYYYYYYFIIILLLHYYYFIFIVITLLYYYYF